MAPQNGHMLNPPKSEALITGNRHQAKSFDSSAGLKVAGSVMQFVEKIKLFGVTIDNNLSFDDHISGVVIGLAIITSGDTAVTLACTIVASKITQCCIVSPMLT